MSPLGFPKRTTDGGMVSLSAVLEVTEQEKKLIGSSPQLFQKEQNVFMQAKFILNSSLRVIDRTPGLHILHHEAVFGRESDGVPP